MRIIAIGAHLDDIELVCGGLIIKAIAHHHQVAMLILSHSAYEDINGKVLRSKKMAQKEGKEAAKILGVDDIEIGAFKTKEIPFNYQSIKFIEKKLIKFKPNLILIPWIYDLHQDHRNVSLAALAALRNFNNILMYESTFAQKKSYRHFKPQIYVEVTGFLNQKIEAISAHRSQSKKYGPRWIEEVKTLAKMRGFESNYQYAESFEVIRLNLDSINL